MCVCERERLCVEKETERECEQQEDDRNRRAVTLFLKSNSNKYFYCMQDISGPSIYHVTCYNPEHTQSPSGTTHCY